MASTAFLVVIVSLTITLLSGRVSGTNNSTQTCAKFCDEYRPPGKDASYILDCSIQFEFKDDKQKLCKESCTECADWCQRGVFSCPEASGALGRHHTTTTRRSSQGGSSSSSSPLEGGFFIAIIVVGVLLVLACTIIPLCVFCFNQSKRNNMPVGPPPPGAVYPQATFAPNPMLSQPMMMGQQPMGGNVMVTNANWPATNSPPPPATVPSPPAAAEPDTTSSTQKK